MANAGSVAMPGDGDPRASYLLVRGDAARIARVADDIDREQTARLDAMRRSGRFLAPRSTVA